MRPEIEARLFNEDCIGGMKRLEPGSVDTVLADPPYGCIHQDWDVKLQLPEMWAGLKRVCKPDAAILMFAKCPFSYELGMSNFSMLRYEWIWDKHKAANFMEANRKPLNRTESVLVFYDRMPVYNPQMSKGEPYVNHRKTTHPSFIKQAFTRTPVTVNNGIRYPVNILNFSAVNGSSREWAGHPTQKPVALCEYLIKTYTDPGDTVLDITAGSGTTAVAAVNTGRDWLAFETAPGYCETAARRIGAAMTEQEQKLFSDWGDCAIIPPEVIP
jgi:site-specific DNA-methyltransferase (adenine-specific)